MDTGRLLCPTLSVVLVKTIKALCEINVKYDDKLEITGSIHVRSDGHKVLSCLLDEETVKGQQDAARVAELAARLSMAAAAFPFTAHIPMATTQQLNTLNQQSGQQQQQINADIFQITSADGNHLEPLQLADGSCKSPGEDGQTQRPAMMICSNSQLAIFHHQQNMSARQNSVDLSIATSNDVPTSTIQLPIDDTRIVRQLLSNANNANVIGAHRKPRNFFEKSKISTAANNASNNQAIYQQTDDGQLTLLSGNNHIKLPDIQTLAHSLPPKYAPMHGSNTKAKTTIAAIAIQQQQQQLQQQLHQLDSKNELMMLGYVCEGQNNAGGLTQQLEAMMEVQPDILNAANNSTLVITPDVSGAGEIGSPPGRKKFQCMFCGIYLSTKCYLKNHVNAMHTRSRVYPCELCERYFYSAGALRIHKLRNHWQGAKKHACIQCRETFLLPIELRKHLLKKHYNNVSCGEAAAAAEECMRQLGVAVVVDEGNEMKLEEGGGEMPHLQPEALDETVAPRPTSMTNTPRAIRFTPRSSTPASIGKTPPLLSDENDRLG